MDYAFVTKVKDNTDGVVSIAGRYWTWNEAVEDLTRVYVDSLVSLLESGESAARAVKKGLGSYEIYIGADIVMEIEIDEKPCS